MPVKDSWGGGGDNCQLLHLIKETHAKNIALLRQMVFRGALYTSKTKS